MGPTWGTTWVLSAPDGPHVGPMNLAIRLVVSFGRHSDVLVSGRRLFQCVIGCSFSEMSYVTDHMCSKYYRCCTFIRIFGDNDTYILVLALNVRGSNYSGSTESILLLLMPWLLALPGNQQPLYLLCRIGTFVSYMRKNFNYLWHDVNCRYIFMFLIKI